MDAWFEIILHENKIIIKLIKLIWKIKHKIIKIKEKAFDGVETFGILIVLVIFIHVNTS